LATENALRETPLHRLHLEAGARMVDFAGWHLPVLYTSVIDEHRAVRTRAGLFDVSPLGEALVHGRGALDHLQRLTCNDVSRLAPGRAQYSALTTEDGTFVDDLLVYQLSAQRYMLVLNASNTAKDLEWIRRDAALPEVVVEDVSSAWALLALQGPRAAACLAPLVPRPLDAVRYYHFVETEVDGVSCIVARTGYTGEDGFEIYAPAAEAARLWKRLLDADPALGVVPVGLGARDTLRLEARYALYGNDIDETTTVVEADLTWIVKPAKGEFAGRSVLVRQIENGTSRKLVGFEMRGRGIARSGHPILQEGQPVGRVTSGSHSPTLGRAIGLAYVPIDLARIGATFHVEIRGRAEEAMVVPTPFYRREPERAPSDRGSRGNA